MLMAYRLGEDTDVRLPVIVNLDGFYLSFTREPVERPEPAAARAFVGDFHPGAGGFQVDRPVSQAVAVLGGGAYSYFRYEMHLASQHALEVYGTIEDEFEAAFGRRHGMLESYRADDAEVLFVMMGSFATKARGAVDALRSSGVRAGLVRLRLLRPLPVAQLRAALGSAKAVAVIDQNLSLGMGGILHAEIAGALSGAERGPGALVSFIGGLGGRDIATAEFIEIAATAERAAETGDIPPPRLMYTEVELRELRKLQAVAHVERLEAEPAS
jgi:pyruvate ferredoxin oxidoreductase alpha subunit